MNVPSAALPPVLQSRFPSRTPRFPLTSEKDGTHHIRFTDRK